MAKAGLTLDAGRLLDRYLTVQLNRLVTNKSNGSVNDYDEYGRRSILEEVDVNSEKLNIPDLEKASQDDTKALTNGFDSWLHNVVGEVGNAEFNVQGSAKFSKFFIIDEGSLQSLAALTARSGNSRGKTCKLALLFIYGIMLNSTRIGLGQSLCYSYVWLIDSQAALGMAVTMMDG